MTSFVLLPNAEHRTVPGTLELLPVVNTWVRRILAAHSELKQQGRRSPPTTIGTLHNIAVNE